ncbi:MAG TPA: hypothetical protein VHL57_10395 [Flavobacteriales bacterium]|nr:hypothetical protein [Flavobacteriales bacterium]
MSPALPAFAFATLGLCLAPPERVVRSISSAEAPPADTTYYTLKDSLHAFRFALTEAPGKCKALFVDIRPATGTAPVQHVDLGGMGIHCPTSDGRLFAIEVKDLDFDGIPDFRLMRADTDPRIPGYRYWLHNVRQRAYVACPALDSIQHPNFDQDHRLVGSQWSRRPGLRGSSTFRFSEGRLIMMANMEKYTESDHERWVIWGMKDGVLQPVEERTMPLPEKKP